MSWGWPAYPYSRRGPRRRDFYRGVYIDMLTWSVRALAQKNAQKKKTIGQERVGVAAPRSAETIPPHFTPQETWKWEDGDLDYFRYATELWTAFIHDHWGVVQLPAGSDAAWLFFEIAEHQQADNRGTLAYGTGPNQTMNTNQPVLLVFRIQDGYQKFFAAVQSWKVVDHVITQDRPFLQEGKWPRASSPS